MDAAPAADSGGLAEVGCAGRCGEGGWGRRSGRGRSSSGRRPGGGDAAEHGPFGPDHRCERRDTPPQRSRSRSSDPPVPRPQRKSGSAPLWQAESLALFPRMTDGHTGGPEASAPPGRGPLSARPAPGSPAVPRRSASGGFRGALARGVLGAIASHQRSAAKVCLLVGGDVTGFPSITGLDR